MPDFPGLRRTHPRCDKVDSAESGLSIRMSPPSPLLVSPGQRALWFLHQLAPESPADILAEAVVVPGGFDPEAMTRALERVVARHPALRTTFEAPAGEPVPVVHERLPADVRVFDEPFADRRALALRLGEEAERPFDLAEGPVLRAAALQLAPREHLMLTTLHHIACDGWSAGVLLGELGVLYRAFAAGRPSPLPELPLQY
ncbi:MAG TPA: non-ribosomal peptide synthetase, partial [Acidobacteria bacterium]|nr:non-ribosomal peptide synthetase [Acidobacteriota bacterium]